MNKKSAIATAGGLVASFVAGIAAVSFNWGIGTPSAASTAAAPKGTTPTPVKPIIKHRTITVHKKAPTPTGSAGSASAPRTVVLPAQPVAAAPPPVTTTSGSTASGGGESDDGGERGDD